MSLGLSKLLEASGGNGFVSQLKKNSPGVCLLFEPAHDDG
jgi:hypothetical protein